VLVESLVTGRTIVRVQGVSNVKRKGKPCQNNGTIWETIRRTHLDDRGLLSVWKLTGLLTGTEKCQGKEGTEVKTGCYVERVVERGRRTLARSRRARE